jgi:hypothetical protein
MLNLRNSSDVIEALTAQFQIVSGCSDEDAAKYRVALQNLVRIARYEHSIATTDDMKRVELIIEASKH